MKAITTGLAKPLFAATALFATTAMPALAQQQMPQADEDRVTLNILRECARIADMRSRVACYDRNIGASWPVDDVRSVPRAPSPPAPSTPAPTAPQSFGSNTLPPARKAAQSPARQDDTIRTQVAEARELQPGIFLLTLDNGTQWQFVDAMPFSYAPPGKGGTVEIAAAAMGSYLMRYQGQRQVRIRRVK